LSAAGIAQDAIGLGAFSCSTRHIRQLPAISSRSWKQKRGISMPSISQAWRTVVPGGTLISIPSIFSFGMFLAPPALGRPRRGRLPLPRRLVGLDPLLHHRPEMADEALHRPCRRVAQRTDRMALDLAGDVEQHVDLLD